MIMKSIIAVVAYLLCLSTAAYALRERPTTVAPPAHSQTHEFVYPVEVGFTFDLPAGSVVASSKHVRRPAARRLVVAARAKTLTCGEWVELVQGSGSAKTCEWM